MNDIHETPDIEVEADQWEDEQKVLYQIALGAETDVEGRASMTGLQSPVRDTPTPFCLNSCDALRIIDGVGIERDE